MRNEKFPDSFGNNIREQLLKHHSVYKIPPKAEYLENLFYNALIASGITSDWSPFGHGVGKDIIENSNRCSIKTGQYNKTENGIKYSSYRTTKYNTLQEKLNYFDIQEDNIDYYLFCVPKEVKSDLEVIFIYNIYYKDTLLKSKNFFWSETYNKQGIISGWKGVIKNKLDNISIIKSMSDQFWCELHINNFIKVSEIKINVAI